MRLFRRRQDAPPPTPVAPEAPAPDGEDVARPDKAPVGDWMTVPPMPATVRPMAPTFRVQTLPEILTSHHSVRLSGSLGHSVSPEAPSGSVQGLAVTNPGVQAVAGHGELPLRTPHPPEPVTVQPLVIRRLAISDSPAPAEAPALPAPAVTRVLAAPARPATPPAAGLPVARLVDSRMAAPGPAAPAASGRSAEDATSPAPTAPDAGALTAAPLVGDDRVGGFAVDLQALTDPIPTPELRRPAPAELDPPIQPRTLQRRVNPGTGPVQRSAAPVAGTAPAAAGPPDAPMPLSGGHSPGPAAGPAPDRAIPAASEPGPALDDEPADIRATGAPEAGSTSPMPAGSTPASDAPGTDATGQTGRVSGEPDAEPAGEPLLVRRAPLVGGSSPATNGAPTVAGPAGEATGPLVLRNLAGPAPATSTSDAPLVAGDTLPGSSGTPASQAGGAAAAGPALPLHGSPAGAGGAGSLPPVQRNADSGGPTPAPGPGAAAPSGALGQIEAATAAPLAGERPLGPPGASGAAGDPSPPDPHHQDLPLVVPGGAKEPDARAPSAALPTSRDVSPVEEGGAVGADAVPAGEPAQPPPAGPPPDGPVVVPTLGVGHGTDLAVQTSPDTGGGAAGGPSGLSGAAPAAWVAHLPLAPLEQPGTLGAPASAGPSAGAGGSVLARPPAAGAAGGPGSAATATASLQRVPSAPTTGASTTTAAPLRTTLQLAVPATTGVAHLGSSGAGADSRPLQRAGSDPLPAAAASAPLPAANEGGAAPSVLRRLPAMAAGAGAGAPPAALGRVANATGAAPIGSVAAASSSSRGAEPLPLHTPAAAVPTAADVAVRAGLAERQPDGSLFYSSPPAGSAAPEAPVQRVLATGAAEATPPAGDTTDVTPAPPAAGADAKGAGGAGGGQSPEDLDLLARRLYKRLRSEMQADIARQLEAKNRAGRYRR